MAPRGTYSKSKPRRTRGAEPIAVTFVQTVGEVTPTASTDDDPLAVAAMRLIVRHDEHGDYKFADPFTGTEFSVTVAAVESGRP